MLKGKTVLVTGGTGSIGSEIVRQVLQQEPEVVRVYSRDETKQFDLQHELRIYGLKVRYLVGDIRDYDRLRFAMDGVDVVFHAGALKHVPSCEFNPFEAVKTNIVGTQNVIQASLDCNVDRVIAISTDKAVGPSNTMGATKLLAEKLISSANLYKGARRTRFACVRFGNVMGSRGSVIPLFVDQMLQGKPITITDPNMRRFMMSIPNAVRLVLKAGALAEGGETFILKMPIVNVSDVSMAVMRSVSQLVGIPEGSAKIVGPRAGEKLDECLIGHEESSRAFVLDDMFVILPDWTGKESGYAWMSDALVPENLREEGVYGTHSGSCEPSEAVFQLIEPVVRNYLDKRGYPSSQCQPSLVKQ